MLVMPQLSYMSVAPNDPHFSNVVLLASLAGAAGGTTFPDDSAAGHSLTGTGNVQTSVTNPPIFQGSSTAFDGSGDYITISDSADWDFGSGDFTVELYVRHEATVVDGILCQYSATNEKAWGIFNDGNAAVEFYYSTNGTTDILAASYNHGDHSNSWRHCAVSRVGNTLYLCWDGFIRATGDMTGVTIYNSNRPLALGGNTDGTTAQYQGRLAELRITKGVGRYAGSIGDAINIGIVPFPRL